MIKEIFVVMVCDKFKKVGTVSTECYTDLQKAQEFCSSRYNARKVNEMYWASSDYDYFIKVLNIK